jgi:hypothetical protein
MVLLDTDYFNEALERFKESKNIIGWSPAPGQLPPREAADDGE